MGAAIRCVNKSSATPPESGRSGSPRGARDPSPEVQELIEVIEKNGLLRSRSPGANRGSEPASVVHYGVVINKISNFRNIFSND